MWKIHNCLSLLMNSSHYSIKPTMNVLWAFFQLLANYHICIYLFLFFLGYLFRILQPNSKRWRSYSWVEKNGTKNLKIYMHRHNMHYFLFLCHKSVVVLFHRNIKYMAYTFWYIFVVCSTWLLRGLLHWLCFGLKVSALFSLLAVLSRCCCERMV